MLNSRLMRDAMSQPSCHPVGMAAIQMGLSILPTPHPQAAVCVFAERVARFIALFCHVIYCPVG